MWYPSGSYGILLRSLERGAGRRICRDNVIMWTCSGNSTYVLSTNINLDIGNIKERRIIHLHNKPPLAIRIEAV